MEFNTDDTAYELQMELESAERDRDKAINSIKKIQKLQSNCDEFTNFIDNFDILIADAVRLHRLIQTMKNDESIDWEFNEFFEEFKLEIKKLYCALKFGDSNMDCAHYIEFPKE